MDHLSDLSISNLLKVSKGSGQKHFWNILICNSSSNRGRVMNSSSGSNILVNVGVKDSFCLVFT